MDAAGMVRDPMNVVRISERDSGGYSVFCEGNGVILEYECASAEGIQAFSWDDIKRMLSDNPALLDAPLPSKDISPEEEEAISVAFVTEKVLARLQELDLKSIRALRAIQQGTASKDDANKLAAIEDETVKLRSELSALKVSIRSEG